MSIQGFISIPKRFSSYYYAHVRNPFFKLIFNKIFINKFLTFIHLPTIAKERMKQMTEHNFPRPPLKIQDKTVDYLFSTLTLTKITFFVFST